MDRWCVVALFVLCERDYVRVKLVLYEGKNNLGGCCLMHMIHLRVVVSNKFVFLMHYYFVFY